MKLLTPEIIHSYGFTSGFITDPQERPATIKYIKGQLEIIQYKENENLFTFFSGCSDTGWFMWDLKFVWQFKRIIELFESAIHITEIAPLTRGF